MYIYRDTLTAEMQLCTVFAAQGQVEKAKQMYEHLLHRAEDLLGKTLVL
jgi:hypothetical protein